MDCWNPNHFSLFLLLFSVSTSTLTATSSSSSSFSSHVTLNPLNPFEGIVCSFIQCGQGTCKASNNSLLGFDCECDPGWKKIQIGPLTFPSCLIPNCTVDFHCGNGSLSSPAPPPPPASLPPPPANGTNHCDLVWCGDGNCVSNETGHICQCNQGSENLLSYPSLACFKPCYLGADCQGLDLPLGHSQPPPPPPPPPTSSSSDGNGLNTMSTCLGALRRLPAVVLAAAFLSWYNY